MQHRAEARGHRKAPVVRRRGEHHDEAVRPAFQPAAQVAVGIAGHDEVVAVGDVAIGQVDGRKALRAAARAGERDEQRRDVALEVLRRRGDEIGRRERLDAPTECTQELRQQALADVRR